jgi:ethanolamine transporter EutH
MKRIVLICGLIAGAIVSTFMVTSTAACYEKQDFDGSLWVGYASMILAFSLIFVGVKNYRDKYNSGFITFGKAFKLGLYITLVASTVYVIVWLIDYYFFVPEFMDRYADFTLRETQKEGATAAELQQKVAEMNEYKELYKNPLVIVLMTYAEILPVGLIVSLICALILKKPEQQVNRA